VIQSALARSKERRVERGQRVVALVRLVGQGAEAVRGEIVGHGRPPFTAWPTAARTWRATATSDTRDAASSALTGQV
jgi:hypothetical protein